MSTDCKTPSLIPRIGLFGPDFCRELATVLLGGQPIHRKRFAGFPQDVRALNWAWTLDFARGLYSLVTETKQPRAAKCLQGVLVTGFGTEKTAIDFVVAAFIEWPKSGVSIAKVDAGHSIMPEPSRHK